MPRNSNFSFSAHLDENLYAHKRVLHRNRLLFRLRSENRKYISIFSVTMACNSVAISLFVLAGAERPTNRTSHEYSYKQLNCARSKICALHKLYGAVANRSPITKIKYSPLIWKPHYYHITSYDSIPSFLISAINLMSLCDRQAVPFYEYKLAMYRLISFVVTSIVETLKISEILRNVIKNRTNVPKF